MMKMIKIRKNTLHHCLKQSFLYRKHSEMVGERYMMVPEEYILDECKETCDENFFRRLRLFQFWQVDYMPYDTVDHLFNNNLSIMPMYMSHMLLSDKYMKELSILYDIKRYNYVPSQNDIKCYQCDKSYEDFVSVFKMLDWIGRGHLSCCRDKKTKICINCDTRIHKKSS